MYFKPRMSVRCRIYPIHVLNSLLKNCADSAISPLLNNIVSRLTKNDEMQGAPILWNEAYMHYAEVTKDEARHSRSRFSTA